MDKKGITKLLREALGVPSNITTLGKHVFDKFLSHLSWELPSENYDFDEFQDVVVLNGDFNIADYSFKKIMIKVSMDDYNTNKPILASMSYFHDKSFDRDEMKVTKGGDMNTIRLSVEIALKPRSTKEEILDSIYEDESSYISSFTHELKHAYDGYKYQSGNVVKDTEYGIFSNDKYSVPTLDRFLHYSYFIHNTENLVRASEVASEIETGNITKKEFISFLASNSVYRMLKEINELTLAKIYNDLAKDKGPMLKILNASSIQIPEDDDEFADAILTLFFLNLRKKKITKLTNKLYPPQFQKLTDDSESKQSKFLKKYEDDLNKFENYEQFFTNELAIFKDVSGKMMKKINKLYAMAKDDENVAEFLNKINNKVTNESIKNWDAYHAIKKTKTSTFEDLR